MRLQRVLRLFIVAEFGFVVLAVSADIWLRESLPELLQQYLRAEIDREWSSAESWKAIAYAPSGGLHVAGAIGLWNLKSWSRVIYTTGWGLFLLAAPLMSPSVLHGVASTLMVAASLAAGMTLSLIWFSSLSDQFRPKPP